MPAGSSAHVKTKENGVIQETTNGVIQETTKEVMRFKYFYEAENERF